MNQLEGVSYFYSRRNGLNELVAVENGRISAYAFTTDIRMSVRDLVNQMMMTELFDIAPEARVLDSRGVSFYSWRGTNAYMGIKVVGGLTPKHIYSNQVIHVIVYSDKKYCSVMN